MLGKLIKYDLKFILKSVSIYIVILLVCALLVNLTAYDCQIHDGVSTCDNVPASLQVAHAIFWNIMLAVGIIGLFLNVAIRTWARFKVNFYHDEAYLTHTLPVKRRTLWAAKCISAAIVAIIVIAAIAISFSILQLTSSGKTLAMSFGFGVPDASASFYFIYIFTILTQLLYCIICGFTGIIIGDKTGNRSSIRAIICGFAVYLLGVLIMLGCFLIWSTFDDGIHAMLFTGASSQTVMALTGEGFIEKALAGIGIIYAIMIATLYFVDQKLLERGIDVD